LEDTSAKYLFNQQYENTSEQCVMVFEVIWLGFGLITSERNQKNRIKTKLQSQWRLEKHSSIYKQICFKKINIGFLF